MTFLQLAGQGFDQPRRPPCASRAPRRPVRPAFTPRPHPNRTGLSTQRVLNGPCRTGVPWRGHRGRRYPRLDIGSVVPISDGPGVVVAAGGGGGGVVAEAETDSGVDTIAASCGSTGSADPFTYSDHGMFQAVQPFPLLRGPLVPRPTTGSPMWVES